MKEKNVISVEQLQVGVYVLLDVGWMNHPFNFSSFKIKDKKEIKTIKGLGLKGVRWDPERSDIKPLPKPDVESQAASDSDEDTTSVSSEVAKEIAEKQARIERLAVYRNKVAALEEAFLEASSIAQSVMKNIQSQPADAINEAEQLVHDMVASITSTPDVAVQVISGKPGGEDAYSHALNVSVLSVCLAREYNLKKEHLNMVGLGAILHDIGLCKIPEKILRNRGELTKAERMAREHHCYYGEEIGKEADLPEGVLNIIYQHHEHFDGTGYPQGLNGSEITKLAQLVAIVNRYDNLCNPINPENAMTPSEALAHMFAKESKSFNPSILQKFIRFMGVYPPGTVVGLSNDHIGMVIKVNPSNPLGSTLILYDEDVPKNEAIILDLNDEPNLNISKTIQPAQLSPSVFNYLSPLRRKSYYFDNS
ncbi:MAG: DUF3391 domain-containing protein [Gammaproteobacteria bacterium]|nr:DUF3391 domain-containing protein [Gammaproteobacteria bacterium]